MAGLWSCASHGGVIQSRRWLCHKWKPLDIPGTQPPQAMQLLNHLLCIRRSSVTKEQQFQNTSCVVVHEVVSDAADEQQDTSSDENYKKQLMDQLEKKVEEKSKSQSIIL